MKKYKRTTLIATACLSVLVGLGAARWASFYYADWLVLFLPSLLILKKKNLATLLVVITIGLLLGLWRGTIYEQKLTQLKSLSSRPVTVELTATSDAVYANQTQLQFTASNARLISPHSLPLAGNFKISGFGVNMIYRGDIVRASGKLYPTRGSNQANISYAQLELVAPSHSWFNDLSRRFSTGMQNALPEPLASFGMGLLIGQRINMPDDIKNQLVAVGLVHIVAVSGYNLTILIRAIQRVRLRSKYQQLVASLALIALFLSITGFSASIVRAAVVSSLSLLAWYYGRRIRPIVLIAFAAAATGLANPFYVWGDLSWYLSFLAFFGIMIIAPIIQRRLFKVQPKFITIVLIETLSAELMTLPLIMMTFSQLSLIAIMANLLVVPLVPPAMLLSAIAGAAGALMPQLAGWLAWPAGLLLTYMLDIIHLLASIPSVLARASISPTLMIGFYIILLAVSGVAYHKSRHNTLENVKI